MARPNVGRRVHLAIIEPRYLELILAGEKTVEARLSRTRRDPLGVVTPGERVYFKARGGAVGCCAAVERVDELLDLTAPEIDRLRGIYNDRVLGTDEFWQARSAARYAVFVHLRAPAAADAGPMIKPKPGDRRAWFAVPAALDPKGLHPKGIDPDGLDPEAAGINSSG